MSAIVARNEAKATPIGFMNAEGLTNTFEINNSVNNLNQVFISVKSP